MKKSFLISLLIIFFSLNYNTFGKTMKDLPYHHLPDGTFRNPEGSPLRDPNFKWDMSKWNKEKKKIKINIPADHVIDKNKFISGISFRSTAGSAYLFGPKINGPIFFEKTGSVIIVVSQSLIKNVACPIQAT